MRHQFLSSRVFSATNVRHMITSCVNNNETNIHGSVNQFSENVVGIDGGSHEDKIDAPHHNYIDTSTFQRIILSVGSSVAALVNPQR